MSPSLPFDDFPIVQTAQKATNQKGIQRRVNQWLFFTDQIKTIGNAMNLRRQYSHFLGT